MSKRTGNPIPKGRNFYDLKGKPYHPEATTAKRTHNGFSKRRADGRYQVELMSNLRTTVETLADLMSAYPDYKKNPTQAAVVNDLWTLRKAIEAELARIRA
jgi:hypothetical protein